MHVHDSGGEIEVTFNNSILAGTVLARQNIQSEGFVAGASGWIIERDGDAEFNSIVVRGSVTSVGAIYTANIFDGRINIFLNSDPDQVTEWSPGAIQFFPMDGSSGLMLDYDEPNAIGFRVSGGDPKGVYMDRTDTFWYKTKSAGSYTKEDWTAPTLNASWTALGELPRYKLLPDGTVKLRGGVHWGGGGNPADGTGPFTLPAGYRPTQNTLFAASFWGTNTIGRLLITPAGQVQVFGAPATDFPLDVVHFSTI